MAGALTSRPPLVLHPLMPDDNQKCVDSLQSSLKRRDIRLPRANTTCDTVLCFCGIRLHQISSLRCPGEFNVSGAARNTTPTAAVRELERNCRNASYAGCTRCLQSLEKVSPLRSSLSHREGHGRSSHLPSASCSSPSDAGRQPEVCGLAAELTEAARHKVVPCPPLRFIGFYDLCPSALALAMSPSSKPLRSWLVGALSSSSSSSKSTPLAISGFLIIFLVSVPSSPYRTTIFSTDKP